MNKDPQDIDRVIPNRAFSIFSGGVDSTLATLHAKRLYGEVIPIFFEWGQKAREEEWNAVQLISQKLNLTPPISIKIPIYKWDCSQLTQGDPKSIDSNDTMVYERNLIFISVSASYARARGGGNLFVGFNKNDIGYDTSETFLNSINSLLDILNIDIGKRKITVSAPLIKKEKNEIILELQKEELLDLTYSCYVADGPCGNCPACRKRNHYSALANGQRQ